MISKKYNEIIKNLENKIGDKELLDFVKNQISDLTLSYTADIESNIKKYEIKNTIYCIFDGFMVY